MGDEIERYIRAMKPPQEELDRGREFFIKWHMERFGSTKEFATEMAEEDSKSREMERQRMLEDPYYNPDDNGPDD